MRPSDIILNICAREGRHSTFLEIFIVLRKVW